MIEFVVAAIVVLISVLIGYGLGITRNRDE
jgi:hypothetical protein